MKNLRESRDEEKIKEDREQKRMKNLRECRDKGKTKEDNEQDKKRKNLLGNIEMKETEGR